MIRLIAKYADKTLKESELVAEFDLTKPVGQDSALQCNDEAGMAGQAQRYLQRQANVSLDAVLKTWERAYIEAAMKMTHGNLSQAAKLLNVNRTTLYSRINMQEEN